MQLTETMPNQTTIRIISELAEVTTHKMKYYEDRGMFHSETKANRKFASTNIDTLVTIAEHMDSNVQTYQNQHLTKKEDTLTKRYNRTLIQGQINAHFNY